MSGYGPVMTKPSGGSAAVRSHLIDALEADLVGPYRRVPGSTTSNEPEVLRLDFLASLCAAFEPDEIRAQLQTHGLGSFSVRTVSDRHLLITGRLPLR